MKETYFSRVLKYSPKETHERNGNNQNKTKISEDSANLCHEIHIHVVHNFSEDLI